MEVNPARSEAQRHLPVRFDWLIYAGFVLSVFASALFGAYRVEADTVAYLDLADAVRNHQWHALVNASWFPLYPGLVAIGEALFGNRPQYELMAARLVDTFLGLLFVLAAMAFGQSVRRLMLARGVAAKALLSQRTLYLWSAIVAWFFLAQDLSGIKPDALVSAMMLMTVAAVLWGIANATLPPFALAGLFAGLAFWTKAFAFPFFLLWIVLVAAASLRRPRVLGGLLVSLGVFALIAGPYIGLISTAKGRFTIGDSGRLNTAWYVNGADRFNPVSDLSIYHLGDAREHFTHPGQLLSKDPEIVYFGGDQVYGTTPQWDDFSYWSDGLSSRFIFGETLAALKRNLIAFALIAPMRLQALVLVFALCCFGFRARLPTLADPTLVATCLLAVGSIVSFALVHFEARYAAFAVVLTAILYAASSVTRDPRGECRSLHSALLLLAGLLLLFDLQSSAREWKQALLEGARPLHGIYNQAVYSVGTDLAARYPRGTEVACMGDAACWNDPLWAKHAELKMTAIIGTGPGDATESADQACKRLARQPAGLELLRQRHVRAIVARFDGTVPCSPAWQALGTSGHFFYLPL